MHCKMFQNKSEVDRHVHNCLKKVNNETERNLRCFSFAKLYLKVGDYEQAYRYISSYLLTKPKSSEGHHLLGKTLEKLGKLDSALEAYKTSLQIDPKQNNLVIKVCEILSSDNIELDLSGARYFCELAQSFDPNNPAVYSLKERLITINHENPHDVSQLLLKELEIRPTDINLRIRLLKHFTENNMIKEAYKHATMVEYKDFDNFQQSVSWYENLAEILMRFQKDVSLRSALTWEFWLLLVSVMERLVALRLDDRNNYKGSADYLAALFNFDQTLYKAVENIDHCTDSQLISTFIMHYHTQLHFHISTLILKQAKRGMIQFNEASHIVLPALFTAYSSPPDIQSVWFTQSPEETKKMVQRWYRAACFRCSQVGHILLSIAKDNKSVLLEKAAQYSSGLWREQLYKKIFIKREQHNKMSSSFFVINTPSLEPTLKLPIISDLLKYDEVAQLSFPDSLHHYVWISLHSNLSDMNLITFEGMQYSIKHLTNCSAESLNLLDVYAFIYCATLSAKSKLNDNNFAHYNLLPASITENLAATEQSVFIESVYKMYKNLASSHLADIRLILIKGIETIRCVGHHGLDVRTLVNLANVFKERSSKLTKQSEIDYTIARAELYWKTALPLLEKIANNQKISYVRNRLFDSGSNELTATGAKSFIDEGKLFIATQFMNKKSYDEALNMFEQLKDPYASFYQFKIYKQFAFSKMNKKGNENVTGEIKNDVTLALTKARDCLYLTLDRLREPLVNPSHPLNSQLGNEIDEIERMLSNIELGCNRDIFLDENRSFDVSISEEYLSNSTYTNKDNSYITKLDPLNQSTPLRLNATRQEARPSPERLDAQIRQMMTSRDAIFTLVSEQNKQIAETHNNLLEKLNVVVNELKLIKKDVEGLKDVSKSVNDIKNSVGDFQNVADIVQEMKKEIMEIKKHDTKNQLSDEDLYVLDPDYGVDYNLPSNIGSYPPLVPGSFPNYQTNKIPNPNQVATYAPAMLYPGIYPGLPYTYGGLNLAQPGSLPFLPDQQHSTSVTVSTAGQHLLSSQSSVSQNLGLDALNVQALPPAVSQSTQQKELPKSSTLATSLKLPSGSSPITPTFGKVPPVNVVITTSDPLPTENTITSQPVLSVTIPPQHIKSNFLKATTTSNKPDFSIRSNEKLKLPIADQEKRLIEPSDSLNRSDLSNYSLEDHEPNVDFKPVIPLPDEVPVNTGEECETELFCRRAKLFRLVNVNGVKEWKERGVGNLKILKNPDNDKTRILMRRDQVFKICANHFITKEMSLYPSGNNEKAFTWAAQDFSDGEIKSETLCVKFKLVEDATKFAEVFKSAKVSSKNPNINLDIKSPEQKKDVNKGIKPLSDNGTFMGGFVFTGTPTFLPKETEAVATVTEVKDTNKNSPFSTFFFGKTDAKFTNLSLTSSTLPPDEKKDDGRSSPIEEFVPTAEFKPVVSLPGLIDIKTGEENSEVLFEERAKLFRFDSSGEVSEWKERGIGTLKVLKDEFIRLLMRRDQVHKVCCNHRVLKDMLFKINSNNSKAVVWQAQDFSEGIVVTEMFTARFKTEQIANDFLSTLQKAKNAMDENSTVVENIDKQDLHATKPNNSDSKEPESPKKTNQAIDTFNFNATNTRQINKIPDVGGFGDAFKIKPGFWECQTCMIRNDGVALKCVACDTTRKDATQQTDIKGIQKTSEKPAVAASGFGDAFKIKPGCWECQMCMIRNEGNVFKCVACGSSKEGGLHEKETAKNIEPPGQKFVFGIPTNTKLTFGKDNLTNVIPPVQTSKWTFGIPKTEVTPIKVNEETESPLESVKSGEKPPSQNSFSFISPTKQEFEFKQKPSKKTNQKSNDDSEDGSYVEEEEDNIYFKPVIPLPDKVQVKTGEEDDDVLYCHKAKLFRFIDGEWKERGVGDIKILKNKSNGSLRVVMRRIQVLKICLNHLLTNYIDYKFKDEKSLMFTAADFSEGTVVNQLFCVRFKNAEITQDFKKAIGNALGGEICIQQDDEKSQSNEDIEIVFETKVTPEEEKEAIRLGLPPKFMSYKQLPDCDCEQCKKDDEYLKDLFVKESPTNLSKTPKSTSVTKQNLLSPSSPVTLTDNVSKHSPLSINSNNSTGVRLKPSVLVSPNNTSQKDISTTSTFSWPSATSNLFSVSNVSFGNSFQSQTNKSENVTPKKEIITTPKPIEDKMKLVDSNKSIFNFDNNQFKTTNIFAQPATNTPIFGQNITSSNSPSIFGHNVTVTSSNSTSIFGQNVTSSNSPTIFGTNNIKSTNLGSIFDVKTKSTEDNGKTGFLFGQRNKTNVSTSVELKETDDVVLKSDPNLSFASLAAISKGDEKPGFLKKDETFSFLGAGTPIFGSLKTTPLNITKNESEDEHNTSSATEEYDPHYEPIIPLPAAITVTTGEENETILFNERAKLFRYDSSLKEWKERGIGQFKVLHHLEKNTYRLLLRREQVYKLVLNQLITPNFELQPMATSEKAWIWAGYNYSDDENAFEKLAIRFKNHDLALKFYNVIEDVVAKLNVSNISQHIPTAVQNFNVENNSPTSAVPDQVDTEVNDDYEYDEDDDDDDDEDGEVDDEEDERTVMFKKECTLSEINASGFWETVGEGCVEIYYDPELFAARIVITDYNSFTLSNTLITINTVMEIDENECIWKSLEWGDGNVRWRNLKVVFSNESAAEEFHSNYLEGIHYAQQIGLTDDFPVEFEQEDN